MEDPKRIRALLERVKAAKAAGNLSPEQESAYVQRLGGALREFQNKDATDHAPSMWDAVANAMSGQLADPKPKGVSPQEYAEQILSTGQKAQDLATGAAPTRMALGELMGANFGKEDMRRLIDPSMPNPEGSEILYRAGVAQDTNKSGQLKGKSLTHGLAATALDLADPGAIMGLGELAAGAVKGTGQSIYKSGMKQIDKALEKAGKGAGAFSETAMRQGISGNAKQIMEQSEAAAEKLLADKQAIIEQYGHLPTDLPEHLENLSAQLDKVTKGKDEFAAQAAQEAKAQVDAQLARIKDIPAGTSTAVVDTGLLDASGRPVTKEVTSQTAALSKRPNVKETDEIKTSLYKNMNPNVYDNLSRTDQGQKAIKADGLHGS
jgi:hypothetical protein